MIKRQKVEALILSRRKIGDADRLVTFFTREQGIIRAVAKGVRKIPSQRGGHLEPYTQVRALVSEGRVGIYVGAVETDEYFSSLKADTNALQHARNISLVVTSLFSEHEVQEEIYDAVVDAWSILPRMPKAKRELLEGAIMMLSLREAGLMPNLQSCQVCGVKKPSDSVVMRVEEGGWRCLSCNAGFHGTRYSLSPRVLQVVRFMAEYPHQASRVAASQDETGQLISALRWCMSQVIGQSILATE